MSKNVITRPAAFVRQGKMKLYATSLKVSELLIENFYDITRFDPLSNTKGYQRLLNVARAKKLSGYVLDSYRNHEDPFLPTSIFIATDKELVYDEVSHTITIDMDAICPFNVVDGQHRLEGLRIAANKNQDILTLEMPVNIATNLSILEQMGQFLIVNTTQKSVDKAVVQRIYQMLSNARQVENLPTLPKWIDNIVTKGDDDKALRFVDFLNGTPESPWYRKILMANSVDKDKPVNQKTFVEAIKKYFLVNHNIILSAFPEKSQNIFMNYWKSIIDVIDASDKSVLYKYNGVNLFCMFSVPFLNILCNKGDFTTDAMKMLLRKTFENMDNEFSTVGYAEYWESGGTASFLNIGAMLKVNNSLIEALHAANDSYNVVKI